jgi:hypothetical protein
MLQLFQKFTIPLFTLSNFAVFRYLQFFSSDIALYTLSSFIAKIYLNLGNSL